jgi:hypothetical protein
MEYLLYVDSRNRDTSLYPSGNNYVLNLVTPIRNVSRVELMFAKVPNTMYNLNTPSFLTYTNTISSSNLYLPPGFYSADQLSNTLTVSKNVPTLTTNVLPAEGKLLFISTDSTFSLTPLTEEATRLTGITGTLNSAAASTFPEYANNTVFSGKYLIKSSNVINTATNEFVFLDIEEFRTTRTHDARKMVTVTSTTPSGNTIVRQTTDSPGVERVFAMFPMDVDPGKFKVYDSNSDTYMSADFPQRIPKVAKLTVRWQDAYGNLLAFNGVEQNSFLLRLICDETPVTLERPEGLPSPVEIDKGPDQRRMIIIAVCAVLLLGLLVISFMKKST